ncbi:MAG: hypothetical protein JKP92_05305 [Alphaproteobacteria bacterium]|jgi:hypothetical protein|nr:hypothetical protein [Alphaproteobacteria bacterium]
MSLSSSFSNFCVLSDIPLKPPIAKQESEPGWLVSDIAHVCNNPALAQAYADAFARAFAGECAGAVALAEGLLAPHGGRLFAGYRRLAPEEAVS